MKGNETKNVILCVVLWTVCTAQIQYQTFIAYDVMTIIITICHWIHWITMVSQFIAADPNEKRLSRVLSRPICMSTQLLVSIKWFASSYCRFVGADGCWHILKEFEKEVEPYGSCTPYFSYKINFNNDAMSPVRKCKKLFLQTAAFNQRENALTYSRSQ